MPKPPSEVPAAGGSEGSPSPTLHSAEEWQRLRLALAGASDAGLVALLERYAFNVVWPALELEARRERLVALPTEHKRQLLDQLFARMIEKLTIGAGWEGLT